MPVRTAAERAQAVLDWLAQPKNVGHTPTTDVDPPGARARARPTKAQKRVIEQVVEQHRREVAELTRREMELLAPVFAQAQRELAQSMREWMTTAADGELRWTAQSYRAALAQIREGARVMQDALGRTLVDGTAEAQAMAVRHVAADLARFSETFTGSVRRVPLNVAKQVATGRSYIIPRIQTSAARYAGAFTKDIQHRLAIDILKGASVRETTNRLVDMGGPSGWVATRGMAWSPTSVMEFIPEGLFKRYRYFAERIVRTETCSAYGAATVDSLAEAAVMVKALKKIWMASPRCCADICREIDGQVVEVEEKFTTRLGPVDHSPAHPNCRCTVSGWNPEWGDKHESRVDEKQGPRPPAGPPPGVVPPGATPVREHDYTLDAHTRGGREAQRRYENNEAQFTFFDDVDLLTLEQRVWREGVRVRGTRQYPDRFELTCEAPIGVRRRLNKADVPLRIAHIKARLDHGEWRYHMFPRGEPRPGEGR